MEVYRVNIDFELQLKEQSKKTLKPSWQREWEYLLWWAQDENCLLYEDQLDKSVKSYEPYDLNYIKDQTRRDQLFKSDCEYQNWWGNLNQKKIISKADLPQIRKKALADNSSYVLEDDSIPKLYPCIVKKDYSFSGKGVYLINSQQEFKKVFKKYTSEKLIVESFHHIKEHFSLYVFSKDRSLFYQTFSHQNEYRGCLFNRGFQQTQSFQEFSQDHSKVKHYIDQVFGIYDNYGIDCYTHQDGIQPLCEINHRRTIASSSAQIFDRHFEDFVLGRSFIFKALKIKPTDFHKVDRFINKLNDDNNFKVLRLSPLSGQYFFHFFVGSNSLSDIHFAWKLIQDFFNLP